MTITARRHAAKLARLSRYTHQLLNVDFAEKDSSVEVDDLEAANVITSRVANMPGHTFHTLMIDLDVPAQLVPSSTPGHTHLYIDVPMTWPQYVAILNALAAADIVQPGYVAASRARRATCLRLPWIKKDPADQMGYGA